MSAHRILAEYHFALQQWNMQCEWTSWSRRHKTWEHAMYKAFIRQFVRTITPSGPAHWLEWIVNCLKDGKDGISLSKDRDSVLDDLGSERTLYFEEERENAQEQGRKPNFLDLDVLYWTEVHDVAKTVTVREISTTFQKGFLRDSDRGKWPGDGLFMRGFDICWKAAGRLAAHLYAGNEPPRPSVWQTQAPTAPRPMPAFR
ncbi:hypothetical protein BDZ89DRAFT_1200600 [Hymenopellis radicata]|nr:hypothetical protein BDZ89DRAFT_1200600 [Hymenopellis radicata]